MHPDGLQRELGRREQGENFPVALKFLPGAPREGLHAIYAYARTVDELGDSLPGDRTAALHAFADDLDRIWTDRHPVHPVLRRLDPVVRAHNLPADPFHRLIEANLQDQTVTRYRTFDDLVGYCRLSADPVGRMVLGVFHVNDPETERLSDLVCTALQLVEHWQDVAEDRRAGRIYLPQEDLTSYGVPESDLDQPAASEALRRLMMFETDRAGRMLDEGSAIVRRLHGWARVSVAGFVAGGQATVRALRRTGGDVLAHEARPSKAETVRLLIKAVAR
ncbi:squalene synthase HpnC [Kribbella sp. VKM Ac-2571]|uniref:squalene synthase HpnC n=1 Tax=Kribbella sp. VKM Ac-2571 TaxID=2512222 RepID=UPI00105FADB7|nr:squalene synthase HpnC [Kribbella sp. VKM Ac-2571]TDO48283.1 squalene synthase HpnC [Kribbella sp. VKM Ac-2571]